MVLRLFLKALFSYLLTIIIIILFFLTFSYLMNNILPLLSDIQQWQMDDPNSSLQFSLNPTMFKYVGLLALTILSSATLQVYSPECAVKRFKNTIEYTLSNFGEIPYGEVIMGQIRVPKAEELCSIEGESYINNKDPNSRVILLVKRGTCKFTEKVINAQNLGADLIIIYDNNPGDKPSVIMKNDGHGHLAQIPSLFISKSDGENLKLTNNQCKNYPILKVKFDINQAEKAKVLLWLDANNRESFILAREFYKNNYYKILQDKITIGIRFRVDTHCTKEFFCKKTDCVGILMEKYCRTVQRKADEQEHTLNGVKIIEEQLRQHFLWEELPQADKLQWWEYMTKFDHEDCIDVPDPKDCSYTVMDHIGISKSIRERVEKLVQETIDNVTNSRPNILKTAATDSTELGIYFYPEATINDRNFYGLFKASQVFEMICDSLLDPPKECITFIKNKDQISTVDESSGLWKTVLLTLLFMTIGFLAALFIYTKVIRREVDQQLSVEVNKMVQNYVSLAEKKKASGSGNSYSKFES